MEINQNRAYINLKMVDGQVVMYVSRMTEAVRDMGLSCGDVLSEERAAMRPVTIEKSQLSQAEFCAWFDTRGLDVVSFGQRYGVTVHQVRDFLWPEEKTVSK